MYPLLSSDYAKAVSDLMETEHEENQQEQQQRLEKRGGQEANIIMPNNLFFDYPRDDDNDNYDTGESSNHFLSYRVAILDGKNLLLP